MVAWERGYESGSCTCFVRSVFLLEDGDFGLSEGKQSDLKGERICGYLRRVWSFYSGVIAGDGKRLTVLEFVDEKVSEALEFGSLSGPEIEQKGSDLSKFTL